MPDYDVAILGAGPGGYVGAIRAAQLGMRVALIERDTPGGVCLNWGCIPSKVLLHCAEMVTLARRGAEFGLHYDGLTADFGVALDRSRDVVRRMTQGVESLLKQHGVDLIRGSGRLESPHDIRVQPADRVVTARNLILATGASPRLLPNLPVDGVRILTSRQALERRTVPASIAVVGGGPVGLEFAWLYRNYGAEVTVLEMQPHLLPLEDEEVAVQLERSFRNLGIDVRTGVTVDQVVLEPNGVRIDYTGGPSTVDCVLVAIGSAANSEGIGIAELGAEMHRGFVEVDDYCRTSVEGVYAIGDLTGRLPLAHVASAQGVTAVEHIAGLSPPPLDYDAMPRAVYCQPQVASVGLTEAAARERGYEVSVGRFPFRANGRAIALGDTDGLAKVVVDRATGHVLGYHLVGFNAAELIGEASAGALLEMTAEELAYAVHAHPTLSEALKEAALAATSGAIHYFQPRAARAESG